MIKTIKCFPLLFIPVLLAVLVACATKDIAKHADAIEKCIKIGQEWTYDTREGEDDSRLVIVEANMNKDKQRFYIVRVTGVKISSPDFKNYFPDGIPYFIISEKQLSPTLKTLQGESNWNKYFDKYYLKWRRELTHPDYYGPTVKDKLNTIEEMLNIKLGA